MPLLPHYILAGTALVAVFIMFLVIARTMNSIINLLIKLEYIVQKEFDLKKELHEVRRLMEQQVAERKKVNEEGPEAAAPAAPKPAPKPSK
jgi:hypothetical protein